MIIPAHTRTIYIDDSDFKIREKFLLKIPKLEFFKVGTQCRCLAVDENGEFCLPPFLNCNSSGYICFGSYKPNDMNDVVDRFFSTSFNFQAYDSFFEYWSQHDSSDNLLSHFIEFVLSFYKDWEKTGKVKLIPLK